jgi:molybdate transport system ATP-binding protein
LVRFRGQTWQDNAAGIFIPAWRRKVGWVPQEALLFPHLNVAQNLGFSSPRREALLEMAEILGIRQLLDRKPRHLSGGEKQRVALGRALLAGPDLLLLDEPFAALEENLRAALLEKLFGLCERKGMALILVTHQREEAALCREIWSFEAGAGLRREPTRPSTSENTRTAAAQWTPPVDPLLPTIRV